MRVVTLLAAVAAGAGLLPAAAQTEEPRTEVQSAPAAMTEPASPAPITPAGRSPEPRLARTEGAPVADTAAPPARPKPALPMVVARIDLATQRMHVKVHGQPVHSWAISSGREGYPTPRGVFRAQWTARMWYSRKYDNAPMPHAVFFKDGAAIHATSATGLLGRPASHGCIRLAPAHAAEFYALVQKHGSRNVRIEVMGTPPPSVVASRRERPAVAEVRRHLDRRGISAGVPPMRQVTHNARHPGMIHLPPGHPFKGRDSFEMNGIRYVRVR